MMKLLSRDTSRAQKKYNAQDITSGCERQKKKNFVISVNSARASLPEASPYLGALSVQLDMFEIEAQSLPAGMRYCDEVVSKRTSVPLRATRRLLVWHESNIGPQQTVHDREAEAKCIIAGTAKGRYAFVSGHV
jgi:hypothetical protein